MVETRLMEAVKYCDQNGYIAMGDVLKELLDKLNNRLLTREQVEEQISLIFSLRK